jgi:hypothetical protein
MCNRILWLDDHLNEANRLDKSEREVARNKHRDIKRRRARAHDDKASAK